MAGQRFTFGWYLDGQRASPPVDSLGVSVVGPMGLLNILEAQLGLLAIHPSRAERIVQYRDCLHQVDSEQRFYHRSFSTDPLGTASCLLDWRDQWILHGWSGFACTDMPKRLMDMTDVETIASKDVAVNVGQRLKAVLFELQHRKPDIEQVQLVESVKTFPLCWQAVLNALPLAEPSELVGAGQGFLGALQQQLHVAASGYPTQKLTWQDDGSVQVVRAETQALAHHWLATQLATAQPTLLVCASDGARLDAHLAATRLPRQGLKETRAMLNK